MRPVALVAGRLRERVPDTGRVLELDGEATALIDALGDAASAILIDAALSGAAPGTIHRIRR